MAVTAAVIVFVKLPVPGKVKTRLAKGVGEEGAARVYKTCAERAVQTASSYPGAACTVAYADQNAEQSIIEWLIPVARGASYVQQEDVSDLGVRMFRSLCKALHGGARKVVLIGSDIPDITVGVVADALSALDSHDVVFGPALDGGYYLVGVSVEPHGLFKDIAWSTDSVLAQSVARAEGLGLSVAPASALPVLRDIDTIQDLEAWVQGQPHDADNALAEVARGVLVGSKLSGRG